MALRPTIDFLLYDWLHAESLTQRPRFADHSRETFDEMCIRDSPRAATSSPT